jgi:hypothetical protein
MARRPAPIRRLVQIDAMVVQVVPEVVADLKAVGNELPSVSGLREVGRQFLDGTGEGLKALAFDRVEPRLNERLPWGEVGHCRPGCFTIKLREKVTVRSGDQVQVPLEATWFHQNGVFPEREALLKQALVIVPETVGHHRIRVVMKLRRGVFLPLEADDSPARGGKIRITADIHDGQELVVTGLGPSAEPMHLDDPPPPPPRRRRLRLFGRREDPPPPPPPCPGEVIVRLLARTVPVLP